MALSEAGAAAPVLLLKDLDDDVDVHLLGVALASCAAFAKGGGKDAAGAAFHAKARLSLGLDGLKSKAAQGEMTAEEEDEDKAMREQWKAKHGGDGASGPGLDDENLYEILGIGHIGFSASQAQIKKAYQKSVLVHHPDKLTPEEREAAQALQSQGGSDAELPMFLKVQRAFEILSDDKRRKGYDSQFAFDESIPAGTEDAHEFYAIYTPVFEANARFSVKKPVPALGGPEAGADKVRAFYRFWQSFESWRDFSKFDEFKNGDIESAQSRMEKRWMERQNEIQQQKRKKKEYERVRLLVERAQARDPRMQRLRDEEARAKAAAFAERAAARDAERRAKEEREQAQAREAEERLRADKERERNKVAARQDAKKTMKRLQRLLRKCCEQAPAGGAEASEAVSEIAIFWESNAIEHGIDETSASAAAAPELTRLVEAFGVSTEGEHVTVEALDAAAVENGLDAVRVSLQEVRRAKQEAAEEQARLENARTRRQAEEKAGNAQATCAASGSAAWSAEELSYLAKASKKFPPGARNRWQMIANMVNTTPNIKVQRSPEECIACSRQVAMDADQRRQLGSAEAAMAAFHKKLGVTTPQYGVSNNLPPKTPTPPPQEAQVVAKAAAAAATATSAAAPRARGASAGDDDDDVGPAAPGSDVWTPEQQAALEEALKRFPASIEKNERWKEIAKCVPGKKKRDCVERFKALRQIVLEKKAGPSK
jgi:DnaJ family protein C protein 2